MVFGQVVTRCLCACVCVCTYVCTCVSVLYNSSKCLLWYTNVFICISKSQVSFNLLFLCIFIVLSKFSLMILVCNLISEVAHSIIF